MKYIDQFIFKVMGAKLSASGLIWARFAVGFTLISSLMSYGFGKEMHWVHGLGLAFLTWVVALAPERIHHIHGKGNRWLAVFCAFCVLPLAAIEFASHAGYAAGFRGVDASQAHVSKVNFTAKHEAAKDDAANVKLWREQLAELQKQAPWAATVKADALRSELAALKERMVKEEQGQRGKPKGKGKEFEALQDKANAVEQKISSTERMADLNAKIEATQRILDKKREVAVSATHKDSAIGHQGEFFGFTAALFSGNGDNVSSLMSKGAEFALIIGMAFAFMVGPALTWIMAGTERKEDDDALFGGITGSSLLSGGAPGTSAVIPMTRTNSLPTASLSSGWQNDFAQARKVAAA